MGTTGYISYVLKKEGMNVFKSRYFDSGSRPHRLGVQFLLDLHKSLDPPETTDGIEWEETDSEPYGVQWIYVCDKGGNNLAINHNPFCQTSKLPSRETFEACFNSEYERSVDSYYHEALHKLLPNEHRSFNWTWNTPSAVEKAVIDEYIMMTAGHSAAAPIHEMLNVTQTPSNVSEAIRIRFAEMLVSQLMYGSTHLSLRIRWGLGIAEENPATAKELHAWARRFLIAAFHPCHLQTFWHVSAEDINLNWPRQDVCVLISRNLDSLPNLQAAIVQVVYKTN